MPSGRVGRNHCKLGGVFQWLDRRLGPFQTRERRNHFLGSENSSTPGEERVQQ